MSKIPTYYNDFKKNDEGEPEEMVDFETIILRDYLDWLAQHKVLWLNHHLLTLKEFQVARQLIMDAEILGGRPTCCR